MNELALAVAEHVFDITISPDLPESLRGTAGHTNCPNEYVPLVRVRKGSHEQVYAFRGVVTSGFDDPETEAIKPIRTGMIAVSRVKLHGRDQHVRFFEPEFVSPLVA